MHTSQPKHKGSIIAFSLILLFILLSSGLSVITVATVEKKSGLSTQKSVVAFQAADSGTERVLQRIYIENSPAYTAVAKFEDMADLTLADVARNLEEVRDVSCNTANDKVTATNRNDPPYTFEVTFFEAVEGPPGVFTEVPISCTDPDWRDKVVRIKTEGFYRQTARVLELGVKPRPKCDPSDTFVYGGETYGILLFGEQCWMDRNLNIGTMISRTSAQTDNSVVEKYCYMDDPDNCTTNHPNRPDGGLYTWDEAMQYDTNEGAQGICPLGWHIPRDSDWYYLENYIDPTINDPNATGFRGIDGGTRIKSAGSSGFEANLAGTSVGTTDRDVWGYFRTSSIRNSMLDSWIRQVSVGNPGIYRGSTALNIGLSIRCIMD